MLSQQGEKAIASDANTLCFELMFNDNKKLPGSKRWKFLTNIAHHNEHCSSDCFALNLRLFSVFPLSMIGLSCFAKQSAESFQTSVRGLRVKPFDCLAPEL